MLLSRWLRCMPPCSQGASTSDVMAATTTQGTLGPARGALAKVEFNRMASDADEARPGHTPSWHANRSAPSLVSCAGINA